VLTAEEICHDIKRLGPMPLIVLTGGEPLLQVDEKLMQALGGLPAQIAIETNGTVRPKFAHRRYLWITCSPKLSWERTMLEQADELKLVYPAHDPEEWVTFPAKHRFLQPQADGPQRNTENEAATVEYVKKNPLWRLSIQTHKVLGIA
jgi:organic radical activating enzyme